MMTWKMLEVIAKSANLLGKVFVKPAIFASAKKEFH